MALNTRNSEYIVNDGGIDTKYHFETNSGQVLTKDGNLDTTITRLEGMIGTGGSGEGSGGANLLNITTNLLPAEGTRLDIGSPDKRFGNIYVDEAHLAANTLYIDGVPVIGSKAETIEIKADPGQGLMVKTTGVGATKVISENNVEISTSGAGSNLDIKTTGLASRINMVSAEQINVSSSSINLNGEVIVNGGLTVQGTTTTVDTQNLSIKDNIIELNKGQIGSGVSAGLAGIKVDRGDAEDILLVFDETDDKFKFGSASTLQSIATEQFVLDQVSAPSVVSKFTLDLLTTDWLLDDLTGEYKITIPKSQHKIDNKYLIVTTYETENNVHALVNCNIRIDSNFQVTIKSHEAFNGYVIII